MGYRGPVCDASKRITKISVESKLAVDEEKELQKISPSPREGPGGGGFPSCLRLFTSICLP